MSQLTNEILSAVIAKLNEAGIAAVPLSGNLKMMSKHYHEEALKKQTKKS